MSFTFANRRASLLTPSSSPVLSPARSSAQLKMRFGAALWAVGTLASVVLASPDNGTVEGSPYEPNRMLRVEMFSAECDVCCTCTSTLIKETIQ